MVIANSPGIAQSGRPDGITLENFQFGPHNRWAFSHIREIIPTTNIPHDRERILPLDRRANAGENQIIDWRGNRLTLDEIAADHYLDGMLVLKGNEILIERYWGELRPDRPHLMMSVTKSVVGLLAGKLANAGLLDLSKPVSAYVPELAESGWGPDSLQLLLDMRDGADYTEDYDDMTSTVRLQDCAVGWTDADYCPANGPVGGYHFYPTIGRNEENLGKFVYKSGSTDVVGWVLEAVTGQPLAALISEHIWKPMGAEFDANITVDRSGFVLGDGGMNATLRDLGRFGLLTLNDGVAFGEQVIPAAFIKDIETHPGDPDWPYDAGPGEQPYYRSFWWGRGNGEGDIRGLGIHGQYLQVAPEAGIVVVFFASWPTADPYGDGDAYGWTALYGLSAALIEQVR